MLAEKDDSARSARLLERVEQLAGIGTWAWTPATDEVTWSDGLFRLFGFEPGEVTPTLRLVLEHVHPDDVERVERFIEELARAGALPPIDYRIVRKDRAIRHVRASVATVEESDSAPRRIVGSVQDLTERRLTERELAAHFAVSRSLGQWTTLEESVGRLLGVLAAAMELDAGVLWVPHDGALIARVVWLAGSEDATEFEPVTRQLSYPRGRGLPGRAWESLEPVTMVSVLDDPNSERRDAAVRAGLRSAFAFPAVHRHEAVVVLEFYSREETELTERLKRSLAAIGYEVGEFLAHHGGGLRPPLLTARELEVLQLAAEGHSGPEIARRFVVSPSTIKSHFDHIYEKLGVGDRASAVAEALRHGLIE